MTAYEACARDLCLFSFPLMLLLKCMKLRRVGPSDKAELALGPRWLMLVTGPWHQEETCSERKRAGSFHDPDRFCNPRWDVEAIILGPGNRSGLGVMRKEPHLPPHREETISAVTREDMRSSASTYLPDTGRQEWVGVRQWEKPEEEQQCSLFSLKKKSPPSHPIRLYGWGASKQCLNHRWYSNSRDICT